MPKKSLLFQYFYKKKTVKFWDKNVLKFFEECSKSFKKQNNLGLKMDIGP